MGRKQITYAHKRNRNRIHIPQESRSSPLEEISDPEQYLTHPEMARRILKRSRRSGSASTSRNLSRDHSHGHNFKKLRMSLLEENEQEKSLIFPLNGNYNLHTPHPTQLTEDQVFKLESSRGLPLSPDHEFSPVPLVPTQRNLSPAAPISKPTRIARKTTHKTTRPGNDSLSHRTSSRSLKENMSARNSRSASKSAPKSATSAASRSSRRTTRSRSIVQGSRLPLASPYTSQPSSPHTHPSQNLHTQPITKPTNITKIISTTTATSKRTLSDTHYNPNLPQAQSTANSPIRPAREVESVRARRPSAPSATSYRPDVASWFISPSNQGGTVKAESSFNAVRTPNVFDLVSGSGGRGLSVDFNRPPSQLSFNSAYDEDFFGDAQGVSTPFGLKLQKQVQRYEYVDPMESSSSEDEDDDQYLNHRYISHISRLHSELNTNQVKLNIATFALEEQKHSTWVTDSLISVPTALRAYSPSRSLDPNRNDVLDVHMLDDNDEDRSTLDLGPGLGLNQSPCFEDTLLRYDGAMNTDRAECAEQKEETLKELFEGLEIAYGGAGSRPALSRSRSLNLDSLPSPPQSPSTTSNEGVIQFQPLESPVYISPSKAKLPNIHPGNNTNTNKRGTRDRRGTIRASDFPPILAGGGDVGLGDRARRTRSGTVVGPTWNRRERSGTVVAAARPTGLSVVSDVETGEADVNMPLERPAHDADVQMSDCGGTGVGRGENSVEADPMNIVGPWRDEDWPWAVAEPPSPVCPRQKRAENRKRRSGLGLGLKMPKGWELWRMREHDEEDGQDDPLNLLG